MHNGSFIGGLIVIAFGVFYLCWPHTAWKIHNFMWVKGGEPTDFALVATRIVGISVILMGVVMIIMAFSAGANR